MAPERRFLVKTLGCKANLSDSQILEGAFVRRGWRAAVGEESPEVVVVNSCTVTDSADRQSRTLARRLSRDYPGARIVFTGCGAEVDPEGLARSPGIDWVVGNQDKPDLVSLVEKAGESGERGTILGQVSNYAEILSRHPLDREWPAPELTLTAPPMGLTTRAFLKIQEGCDAFCTYCIIPYGRGPSRSLAASALVEQTRGLVRQGIQEVVLTGTNIGDFAGRAGAPGGRGDALAELCRRILSETDLPRLRLSSLDPVEITDDLLTLMSEEPRLCPHLHVSLQSASDPVLRLMKRKYGTAEIRDCLERIARVPAPAGGVFVGMDVITGFPGESEQEFDRATELLRELPWTRLHVFPYSERRGTPATRLRGKVRPEERKRRAQRLQELSLERMTRHLGRASEALGSGEWSDVLLEQATRMPAHGPGLWQAGYTPNYLRVLIPVSDGREAAEFRNRIVSVRPERISVDRASGEAVFIGQKRGWAGGLPRETPLFGFDA